MKMLWAGIATCALVSSPGIATANSGDRTPQVQAGMVIAGTIVIRPDGSVDHYTLDKKDKLPAGVIKEMAKAVPRWKFQPVMRDGKAVAAKSHMYVGMVARKIGHGKFSVGIRGACFGNDKADNRITAKHMPPPHYPRWAIAARVSGAVFLVLEVGRDGMVERAAAQQVNLYIKGSPDSMKRWRNKLAKSSLRAAKHWTFKPPVKGPYSNKKHWLVRVPVSYHLRRESANPFRGPRSRYGQWQPYIPGPKNYIPWADQDTLAGSTDAIPANGGVYPMHQSLHLLTPLGSG